jgi:hypothetical protein
MVEVERYSAKDRKDLHSRERFWFEKLGATLNVQVPNRSGKEYKAEYYENNKEQIVKKNAEYYENNKEKATEYYKNNKEKIAEYYKNNKETLLKKQAEYRQKHKEKISKKRAEKVECECGCVVSRHNLPTHKKTPKHLKLMKEKTT